MHTPTVCMGVCQCRLEEKKRHKRELPCLLVSCYVCVGRPFILGDFCQVQHRGRNTLHKAAKRVPRFVLDDIFPVEGPPSIRPPCWIFVASIPPPPPRADVWWFLCLWLSIGFLVQLSLCVCVTQNEPIDGRLPLIISSAIWVNPHVSFIRKFLCKISAHFIHWSSACYLRLFRSCGGLLHPAERLTAWDASAWTCVD